MLIEELVPYYTKINDLSKLTVTQMRRHYQSALNDELVNVIGTPVYS